MTPKNTNAIAKMVEAIFTPLALSMNTIPTSPKNRTARNIKQGEKPTRIIRARLTVEIAVGRDANTDEVCDELEAMQDGISEAIKNRPAFRRMSDLRIILTRNT